MGSGAVECFPGNANVIVFELICPDRHRFEGWFASSDDFESQKSRGLLSCPVCSGSSIEKLLTAKIGKPEAEPAGEKADPTPALAAVPGSLSELIDYVLLNTENVGEDSCRLGSCAREQALQRTPRTRFQVHQPVTRLASPAHHCSPQTNRSRHVQGKDQRDSKTLRRLYVPETAASC